MLETEKGNLQEIMKKAFEQEIGVKKKALDRERLLLREERKKYSEMLETDLNQNNEFLQEIEILKKDNIRLTEQVGRYKTGVSFDMSVNEPNKLNKDDKRNSTSSHKSNQESPHKDQINVLEEQVKELKTRLHNQKIKFQKEQDEKIELINQQWESKVDEAVARVTEDYNKLDQILKTKDKQINTLSDKVSQENVTQKSQNDELLSLRENISNLEKENKKLTRVKNEIEAKISSQTSIDSNAESKIQEWKDKHNILEEKYWKKDEDIEQLRNEIRNMKKSHAQEIKDYKAQLKEAASILQEQDLELKDEESQRESNTKETEQLINELRDEIEQMKIKSNDIENCNKDLNIRNQELSDQLTEIRTEKTGVEEEVVRLKDT